MLTNYTAHLYFENNPLSREYQIDRCMKVLEMIASIKDRIERDEIVLKSNQNPNTFLFFGADYYKKKLEFDKKVKSRLEQYYNYRLSLVEKF